MKIDKSKLRYGTWYEDRESNVVPDDSNEVGHVPDGAVWFKKLSPLDIKEEWYEIIDPDKCRHPFKYRKKDDGLLKEYHGIYCDICKKHKIAKRWFPLFLKKWEGFGNPYHQVVTFGTHISRQSMDVICAMVQSGDYTFEEAVCVWVNACERCMNVLTYKYTDGKDGYPEYSEEWEKCNTRCNFCKENDRCEHNVEYGAGLKDEEE